MGSDLSEQIDLEKLRVAMNWVIPADQTPGAASDPCVAHLLKLIESLGVPVRERYRTLLPYLRQTDLDDPSNQFAQEFMDHVRDSYYGFSDTGAWEEIGFIREDLRPISM